MVPMVPMIPVISMAPMLPMTPMVPMVPIEDRWLNYQGIYVTAPAPPGLLINDGGPCITSPSTFGLLPIISKCTPANFTTRDKNCRTPV